MVPVLSAMYVFASTRKMEPFRKAVTVAWMTVLCGMGGAAVMMIVALFGAPTDQQAKRMALTVPIPNHQEAFPGVRDAEDAVSSAHPARAWAVEPGKVALVEVRTSRGIFATKHLVLRNENSTVLCDYDCASEMSKALADR